eukprot:XP_014621056.1 uncharacterized protein LOC100792004 isoform X2 [Glycine max]
MTMAGALSLSQFPVRGSVSLPKRRIPRRSFCIRGMSEISSTFSVSTQQEEPTSNASSVTIAPPPNFKPPEPKRFAIRPDKTSEVFGALLPLLFRFATGVFVSGCPFCRKVREIVAILDLDVLFYPCPRNGPNFRQKVLEMGGKLQFPYMVDPNTGASMYESDDIIRYLVDKYGDGNVPLSLSLGFLTTLTAGLGMLSRISKGTTYTPAKFPPKPLKLWAYGGSPFCKLVREVLVELELPHLLVCCARGSPKRNILYQKTGTFQVFDFSSEFVRLMQYTVVS